MPQDRVVWRRKGIGQINLRKIHSSGRQPRSSINLYFEANESLPM